MLFSWLTEKGVLARNPAREVKTEKFSRTEGKTPAFVDGEVQTLLESIDVLTHVDLRDRALLETPAYTFARIGAVVRLKVGDYYPSGKRFLLPGKRWQRKGSSRPSQTRGVPRPVPSGHRPRCRARFISIPGRAAKHRQAVAAGRSGVPMLRRCLSDVLSEPDCQAIIRLIHSEQSVSRNFSRTMEPSKPLNASLAMQTAGPRNSAIAARAKGSARRYGKDWYDPDLASITEPGLLR